MVVELRGERLELLPQKALFWPAKRTLLLADLHLGKIGHFRRAGIPVPVRANQSTLEVLIDLIRSKSPHRVIFLGDLFHSHYNYGWEDFGELVNHFGGISFELVAGNHDVLGSHQYVRKGILIHDSLRMRPFNLTHIPLEKEAADGYNLAGHLHPGISLYGKGRQSVTLPCFYFSAAYGLLPSFGAFTGLSRIVPKKEDRVYVIANDDVIEVE